MVPPRGYRSRPPPPSDSSFHAQTRRVKRAPAPGPRSTGEAIVHHGSGATRWRPNCWYPRHQKGATAPYRGFAAGRYSEMFRVWPLQLASFFEAYDRLREIMRENGSDPATRARAAAGLHAIAADYKKLTDIEGPARRATALAERIERGEIDDIGGRLAEWLDSLRDEVQHRLFFGLTTEEARLYVAPDLPEEVATRFPSAVREVGDASRCLALDFPTASAYHSVRALEVVLQTLAAELGIEKGRNWQTAIDQIEKELRSRRSSQDPEHRAWVKEWDRFYADVAQHFYYLKNAQRNPTMHWSTETFDTRRAHLLREHTIQLLEAVSERLSEAPAAESTRS